MIRSIFFVGFACAILSLLSSCRPNDRDIVGRAERAELEQKAQLARYLYLQVIESHKSRDEIRYRALKGLADVAQDQLFDYKEAVRALEKLTSEFEAEPFYRNESVKWRLRTSQLWREDLQRPDKSIDVLRPLLDKPDLSEPAEQEIGESFLAVRDYKDSEQHLLNAWTKIQHSNECKRMRVVQMDVIQTYSLSGQCEKAISFSKQQLPSDCMVDQFELDFERANCFEVLGDSQKAMDIYNNMIKREPQNTRAHLMLEALKRRQKEKLVH